MMLAVSPSFVTRSSLEEMLETLQRREESGKVEEDKPPALPPRPKSNPKSRPPSTNRRLAASFRVSEIGTPANCEAVNGKQDGKVMEMESGDSESVLSASESSVKGTDSEKGIDHGNFNAEALPPPPGSRRRSGGDAAGLGNFSNKRLRVWYRSPDDSWQEGQVKSAVGEKALVLLSDERVVAVRSQDLWPANSDILDVVDDLGELSYLNEPSVVHTLQCRYSQDLIYTKAGCVLLALNPLKDIGIYGDEFVTAYREKLVSRPHVYAVVNDAYDKMMAGGGKRSIVISGESGAGKTETAKRALEYLATIGHGDGGIEPKVLQISYILEAFGNSKTSRNDNSSRFGTLFEFHFSDAGKMISAEIITFLVEKSRVVHLAQGERSYHIFYQLCAGASADLRARLRIKPASEYSYLNQSNCIEIPSTDDSQKFHILVEALNTVRIRKEDQDRVFELLASILWLGNISFLVSDDDTYVEVVRSEALSHSASLIGCHQDELIAVLSTRKIKAGKDVITRRLTLQQATERRDALAKLIYTSLFDWIVEKINSFLAFDKREPWGSISILEICGFAMSKDKSGFEQFCINYADERLQRHFNHHIFKLEQEEYEVEGIDWIKLNFKDNDDCLDLFERKPTGLISLLDEVSSSPKSTNLTLVTKLIQQSSSNHCFQGVNDGTLSIRHSAGEVVYDTSDFVAKNRDPLYPEVIHLLSSSSSLNFSFKQFEGIEMQSSQNQSFISKLQEQLLKLFQHLDSTTPYFVHCIRPNGKQNPSSFEKSLVLQQIWCRSVVDAIKISKYGYPTRISIEDFSQRFAVLLLKSVSRHDPLSVSVAVLQHFGIMPHMHQVGFSKLFFRAGQIEILEDARRKALQGTREVQDRHCCDRLDVYQLKDFVTALQSYVRGEIARNEFRNLCRLKRQDADHMNDSDVAAVVLIQSAVRAWLVRNRRNRLQNRTLLKDLLRQPAPVEEVQRQASMAETALREKEDENAKLRERIKQLEARWPRYEAKVKSLEEKWQKKVTSLQNGTTKKVDPTATGRLDGVQSPRSYDSDDTFMGSLTPGCGTPTRYIESSMDDASCRESNGVSNPIIPLVKEFERRKQLFDVEAQAIVEVKSSARSSPCALNPVEEVEMLKCRFKSWKREFAIRLREAKAKATRMARSDGDGYRWKWWGLKRRRS